MSVVGPGHDRGQEPPEQRARPDASMTLLTTLLERPLDPSYQQSADRRAAAGLPRATSTRTLIVVLLAILTGFLFAVAAQSLRPQPTAAANVKQQLVARIESLEQRRTTRETTLAALSKQVSDYEALALQQAGRTSLATSIETLEVQAGAVPMRGPGLVLDLDDAPSAGADVVPGSRPNSGFAEGRVSSSDLQILVNGLWAAGAEAISVNGHRLTSTSAIRFAGKAIIVDFRPLTRPYQVTALGDADPMRSRFESSFSGAYLAQLTSQYGIRSSLSTAGSLTVPGDSLSRLVVAKKLEPDAGSSGSPSPSGTTR